MKYVLYGVETNNKGAELMLYAILQEIERRDPRAKVYLPLQAVKQGLEYLQTNVELHYWPYEYFIKKYHLNGIMRRLHLPPLVDAKALKADYFIDASGFRFSDQCNLWGTTPGWWQKLLSAQHRNGAKIVFLPQAFGPLEEPDTRQTVSILNSFASVLMPRDQVSETYLRNSGIVDMNKVKLFPDFTSLVEGSVPGKYEHLKGGICIIPNQKMILKGNISLDGYIELIGHIIKEASQTNRPVYLLNHEGPDDEALAYECQKAIDGGVEVVTGLDALQVKGLISTAYLVVTSRFHGLVSALNSCVPSLATSWSHKYAELYRDYGLENYVLPLADVTESVAQVRALLNEDENRKIRERLQPQVAQVKAKSSEMWNFVWSDEIQPLKTTSSRKIRSL